MIYISSNFEFIRVQNFLESQKASFCHLGEWVTEFVKAKVFCDYFKKQSIFHEKFSFPVAVIYKSKCKSVIIVLLGTKSQAKYLMTKFGIIKIVIKSCSTLRNLNSTTDIRFIFYSRFYFYFIFIYLLKEVGRLLLNIQQNKT